MLNLEPDSSMHIIDVYDVIIFGDISIFYVKIWHNFIGLYKK